MWRISNENGYESGARNWGRLALFVIPAVLGLAAIFWLTAIMTGHDFKRKLSQEDRRAIFVGAWQRPKDKIKIETPDLTCLKVTHVDLDGEVAAVYYQNNCNKDVQHPRLFVQEKAPDGTLLHGGWTRGGIPLVKKGEQAEVLDKYLSGDNRVSSIQFWVEAD